MKHSAHLVFFLFFGSIHLFAQQEYFLFIQSENEQPFYVIIGNKNYSSSGKGNLIIGKLKDSVYQLTVGFPKNQFPEQNFQVTLHRKDHGFQLRKISDQEWDLFNWQTMEYLKPVTKENTGKKELALEKKRNDAFAVLMAGVVNDSAVLYTSIAKVDLPKKISSDIVKKELVVESPDNKGVSLKKEENKGLQGDTVIIVSKPVDSFPSRENGLSNSEKQIANKESKKEEIKPGIIKLSEQDVNGGKEMIFVDQANSNQKDTIRLIIANSTDIEKKVEKNREFVKDSVPVGLISDTTKVELLLKEVEAKENFRKSSGTNRNNNGKDSMTAVQIADTPATRKMPMVNSDCHNLASDIDVDKLRLKMLAESNVDDRINAARKIFKTKCFAARQIKALTELFYTDDGRYKFFDAAFPFVSDSDNFRLLVELLHDDYYINRFKAMVRL